MKVVKTTGTLSDKAVQENLNAAVVRNAANLDYIAMMADVEIPTEEGEANESEI